MQTLRFAGGLETHPTMLFALSFFWIGYPIKSSYADLIGDCFALLHKACNDEMGCLKTRFVLTKLKLL